MRFLKIKFENWNFGKLVENGSFLRIKIENQNFGKLFEDGNFGELFENEIS